MKKLVISDDLSLPLDAITQTFGILAVRGAGKSNLAAVMAEQMFAANLPFVVIDPVGSWYGLRSSADGKGPGLGVPIFGGRFGDVPLEKSGGAVVADTIVAHRLSCVIDVSEFSEGEKIAFLIDFAERLYRTNRDPLHLFLEEADDYVPQRPMREQARLLRAWENIVRRGRARGLGMTMITQRSAALNKNVLTQIETLFALRTTSPQDRKAIESWVEYHGQAEELLESLSSLQSGEAWVWSPSWLGIMKRIRAHRRSTFDSGATPKQLTGSRPPATLADVDLVDVQKKMAATIEKAKETDPRELKKKIAELDRQLKAKPAAVVDEAAINRRIAVALDDATRNLKQQLATRDARIAELLKATDANIRHIVEQLGVTFSATSPAPPPIRRSQIAPAPRSRLQPVSSRDVSQKSDNAADPDHWLQRLPSGERAVLEVLIGSYPQAVDRESIDNVTGYKRSSRDAYLQRLFAKRLVTTDRGSVRASDTLFE
jgi:hypothetical protein